MIATNANREVVSINFTDRADSGVPVANGVLEEELPYVAMTSALRTTFPKSSGRFVIEPDASSGSYFWAASSLRLPPRTNLPSQLITFIERQAVTVAHWPQTGWQIDQHFPDVIWRTFQRTAAS